MKSTPLQSVQNADGVSDLSQSEPAHPLVYGAAGALFFYLLWVLLALAFFNALGLCTLILLIAPPCIATLYVLKLSRAGREDTRNLIVLLAAFLFLGRFTTNFILISAHQEYEAQYAMDQEMTERNYLRERKLAQEFFDGGHTGEDWESVAVFLQETEAQTVLPDTGLLTYGLDLEDPDSAQLFFSRFSLQRLKALYYEAMPPKIWSDQVREMVREASHQKSTALLFQPWIAFRFFSMTEVLFFLLGLFGAAKVFRRIPRRAIRMRTFPGGSTGIP